MSMCNHWVDKDSVAMIKKLSTITAVILALLAGTVCCAASLPVTPPPYWSIPKISEPPAVDGRIGDSEWKQASCFTGYQKFLDYGGGFAPIQTLTFTAWDDQYLYIAFRSPHTYRDIVLVNIRGRDAAAYTDEAFEALLWPPDCPEAYDYIIGLASLYDGRFGDATWNSPGVKYEVSQHDGLFEAEIAIPWKDIETSPRPGMELKAVFAHDIAEGSRLMTNWNYSVSSYHTKSLAGTVVLTDNLPVVRLLEWGPITRGYAQPELELINTTASPAKIDCKLFMGSEMDAPDEGYLVSENRDLSAGETRRIAPQWPVLSANLKIGRLIVSTGGTKLVDFAFPFEFSPDIQTEVTSYPSQHKLKISVDTVPTLVIGPVKSVRMSLLQSGKTLVKQTKAVDAKSRTDFELDISKLQMEDYLIFIEALDPNNAVLRDSQLKWNKPDEKPDWMVHPVANERRVPKAFSPVSVVSTKDGPVHTQIWGRTYTFDKSLFPTQIKSQSRKMLVEPIRLVGTINGKNLDIPVAQVKMVEESPDRVVLRAYAKSALVSIVAETRIEFDGMLYTTFDLTPSEPGVRVDSLKLEFPLAREATTLMHWNNCAISSPGWAGATPEQWVGAFHPIVWLGDENIGLCWFCETTNGWSNNSSKQQLLLTTLGNRTVFAMNIVDKPLELIKPLSVAFGFTATPAKPMPKNWQAGLTGWIESWWDESNQFLHEAVPWNKWHETVDEVHKNGGKVFKYTQTNFLSFYGDLTPEEVVAQKRPGNNYVDTPEKKYWKAEWEVWPQAGMGGKANAFCKKTPWQDLIVAGLKERLDKGKMDGIYFDCSQPRFCSNSLHGCTGGYDILAERNIRLRLYNIFDELGKDYQIFEHISDNMLGPVMNYSAFHYDGEQFSNGVDDYREKLSLERMRAFSLGTNWGHIPIFMSFANSESATSSLMGIWTLHMPWRNVVTKWSGVGEAAKKVENDFGFDQSTKRLGYWENGDIVKGQTDKLKSTIHYKPGSIFIVVSNLGDTEVDASLQLNTRRIGFNPSRLVINEYLQNQPAPPVLTNGVFKCKILPNTCIMSSLRLK